MPGKGWRLYVRSLPSGSDRHVKFCAEQGSALRAKTRRDAWHQCHSEASECGQG